MRRFRPSFLSHDILNRAGVTLLGAYGLTESAGAAAINSTTANRLGSVGRAVPGTTIDIRDDGEIVVTGENVSPGYWDSPQLAAETGRADRRSATGTDPVTPAPPTDACVVAAVQDAIADANRLVSRAERIRKFRILASDFASEAGQLTEPFSVATRLIIRLCVRAGGGAGRVLRR